MRAVIEETRVNSSTQLFITDNDIVPMNVQNKLIHWREVFKMGYFDIGDIANVLILRAAQLGFTITQQRIFDAVGRFCDKTGRTVRYYAETALFYTEEAREEFEMLPFSHFVFARQLGARWREVLEYSAEHPDSTRTHLAMKFMSDYETLYASPTNNESYSAPAPINMDSSSSSSPDVVYNPPSNLEAITIMGRLVESMQAIDKIFDLVELEDSTKKELEEAFNVIKKHLPELVERFADL